jgi:hypothetical protein
MEYIPGVGFIPIIYSHYILELSPIYDEYWHLAIAKLTISYFSSILVIASSNTWPHGSRKLGVNPMAPLYLKPYLFHSYERNMVKR